MDGRVDIKWRQLLMERNDDEAALIKIGKKYFFLLIKEKKGKKCSIYLFTWKSALCSRISSKHCLTAVKLGADVTEYTSKNECAVAIDSLLIAGNCISPDVSNIST